MAFGGESDENNPDWSAKITGKNKIDPIVAVLAAFRGLENTRITEIKFKMIPIKNKPSVTKPIV